MSEEAGPLFEGPAATYKSMNLDGEPVKIHALKCQQCQDPGKWTSAREFLCANHVRLQLTT